MSEPIMLFYPCIEDARTGRISNIVGPAMSHDKAVALLKRRYGSDWLNVRAIPQPVTHPYFRDYKPE
jgi:hypothetical protein